MNPAPLAPQAKSLITRPPLLQQLYEVSFNSKLRPRIYDPGMDLGCVYCGLDHGDMAFGEGHNIPLKITIV